LAWNLVALDSGDAKEQFKQEVERELTGRETEPWEIIYFKLYQSQTLLRNFVSALARNPHEP
jgi:hypothetical protein